MGDFQANFHRPSTGIHTVEGNVAGSRAAQLERKRQHEQELFEQRKQQIIQTSASQQQSMDSKFAESSVATQTEQSFRTKTIGLVTAEEFKRAQLEQQQAEAAYAKRMAGMDDDDDDDDNVVAAKKLQNQLNETPEQAAARRKAEKKAKKKKRKEQKKLMATLSFANNEEFDEGGLDEDNEKSSDKAKPKAFKDPTIDTSFLPDKERDLRLQQERKQLAKQWKEQQEKIKQEALEITYSYWDGSGHRRTVTITKGTSIGDFLEVVRKDLCKEFRELTSVSEIITCMTDDAVDICIAWLTYCCCLADWKRRINLCKGRFVVATRHHLL